MTPQSDVSSYILTNRSTLYYKKKSVFINFSDNDSTHPKQVFQT